MLWGGWRGARGGRGRRAGCGCRCGMRAVHGVPHGVAAVALGHPSVASRRCPRGRAVTLREASGPSPAPASLRVPRAGSPALRHCPRRGAAGSDPLGPHVPFLGAVTSRRGTGPPPGSSSCARREQCVGADGAMLTAALARRRCRRATLRGDAPVPAQRRSGANVRCSGGANGRCSGAGVQHRGRCAKLGAGTRCLVSPRGARCRPAVLRAWARCSVPACGARCRRAKLGAGV